MHASASCLNGLLRGAYSKSTALSRGSHTSRQSLGVSAKFLVICADSDTLECGHNML